jgi:hypothetical protein
VHTAIAPLSFDDPLRAFNVFLTFLIHPQNVLAAVRIVLDWEKRIGGTPPYEMAYTIVQNEQHSDHCPSHE